MDRRTFLLHSLASAFLVACGSDPTLPEAPVGGVSADPASNFHAIYDDPTLRARFKLFLTNVFHLYPEDDLHALVHAATQAHPTDEAIYGAVVEGLPGITPTASLLRYALPALQTQKSVMAAQAAALLGEGTTVDGYLEIGTVGRYRKALGKVLDLQGPSFVVNDRKPSKDLSDMVERGSYGEAGTFVELADYAPIGEGVPSGSVGLVTNYIGFHHAPKAALDGFVASIRRVLRPDGHLLLREHDVNRPVMEHLVGLAHDVFNAGTSVDWAGNAAEIRNFRSIDGWTAYLASQGFVRKPGQQRQAGDPTDNVLLVFARA
jgi:hypothetical protein